MTNQTLTAPKPNSNKILVPQGTHPARLIGFIQMGTAEDSYMGEKKMFNKIRLTWEFPEETHVFKDGEEAKPLVHSQEYTFSMGKKSNLRPIVEGMIGTTLQDDEASSFNFLGLLGTACLVSIKHGKTKTGSDYAKVAGTSYPMKGQVIKKQVNETKILTFANWDEKYFQSQPPFIKEKIQRSDEYKLLKGEKSDDIMPEIKADDLPW